MLRAVGAINLCALRQMCEFRSSLTEGERDGVRRGCSTSGAKIEGFSRALALASRVIIGLMALLLVVAPWTEHYGTFDNFPRGQDFELSLFAFLGFLCLVLLLGLLRKQWLKKDPARQDGEWDYRLILKPSASMQERLRARIAQMSHSPPRGSPPADAYRLPLQI